MKKSLPLIIGIIAAIAIIGVTAAVLLTGDKKESTTSTGNKLTDHDHLSHTLPDACKIFTDADAKAVLGEGVQKGDDTPQASSDDIKVTNCSYTLPSSDVKKIKVATVVVRAPLTDEGIKSNEAVFGDGTPTGSEKVTGYGSDAYWTPGAGTLNILREHSWIMITYGTPNPTEHTLADARLVADKIMANIK